MPVKCEAKEYAWSLKHDCFSAEARAVQEAKAVENLTRAPFKGGLEGIGLSIAHHMQLRPIQDITTH